MHLETRTEVEWPWRVPVDGRPRIVASGGWMTRRRRIDGPTIGHIPPFFEGPRSMTGFRHRVFAGLAGVVLGGLAPASSRAGEWVSLFDGQTLSGWTQGGGAGKSKWTVEDGAITGSGQASMLYSPKGEYKNFQVPRRGQDQRRRQLGHVLPLPQAQRQLLRGLRGPDRQHAPRPDPHRLGLRVRPRLQADRPARHLVHLRGRGRRQELARARWSRTSRSRSTARCSTS